MPEGAARTCCSYCGYTFGTHAPDCTRKLAWLNAYARTLPPARQRELAELASLARLAAASGRQFRYVSLSLAQIDAVLDDLAGVGQAVPP